MALAQSDAAGRRDGLTAVVESGSDEYLARLKAEAEAVSAARAQIDALEATQAAALDAAEQRLRAEVSAAWQTVEAAFRADPDAAQPLVAGFVERYAVASVSATVAGEQVSLLAETVRGGRFLRARATFEVAEDGRVELGRDEALSGSYAGVDELGLLWSMQPVDGTSAPDVGPFLCLDLDVSFGVATLVPPIGNFLAWICPRRFLCDLASDLASDLARSWPPCKRGRCLCEKKQRFLSARVGVRRGADSCFWFHWNLRT